MTTTTTKNLPEVAKKLDDYVSAIISTEKLNGFGRAFQMAEAIGQLRDMLSIEYMTPIMKLQGTKLGFKTDKDLVFDNNLKKYIKGPGYPVEVVRECLIEAVFMGLQPTGNQFNIISGTCYPTKEGCGASLNKIPGLKYNINTGLPRISADKTSCAFDIKIWWSLNGEEHTEIVPKPIKIDAYASVDAMVGKAERKARAWLLSRITGIEVTDGEVEDATHTVVGSKALPKTKEEQELERIKELVANCNTLADLDLLRTANPEFDSAIFDARAEELKAKK